MKQINNEYALILLKATQLLHILLNTMKKLYQIENSLNSFIEIIIWEDAA